MHWQDEPPRMGLNLAAVFGVPDSPTLFRVHILRVTDGDELSVAFAEFWRRVLTDGPPQCGLGWEVLAIEHWPDSGGFTAVFTTTDLCDDQPPVFKLRSEEMERLWYELPDPDDPTFDAEAEALERRWVRLLVQAADAEPAAGLLAAHRQSRPVPLWLTNQTRSKHRVLVV
jgi:hypothetical protein